MPGCECMRVREREREGWLCVWASLLSRELFETVHPRVKVKEQESEWGMTEGGWGYVAHSSLGDVLWTWHLLKQHHPSSSCCASTCAPSTVPVRWASRWQEVAAVVAAQSSHLALIQTVAPLWDWLEGFEQCEGSCPITGVWRAFTPPMVRLSLTFGAQMFQAAFRAWRQLTLMQRVTFCFCEVLVTALVHCVAVF